MKRIIIFLIFAAFLMSSAAQAFFSKPGIDETINKMNLEKNSVVSISVKNVKTGRNVYTKNPHQFLNPASSLKTYTFMTSLAASGKDYAFKTAVYKDDKNNVYIRLGADPLLTNQDLRELIRSAKAKEAFKNVNKIYIEEGVIDKTPYPDGWMTDDTWPFMPKISPYTLDKNTANITLTVSQNSKTITILQADKYKMPVINELEVGAVNDIQISKAGGMEVEMLHLKGTVEEDTILQIPVSNPKIYFVVSLYEILKKENIAYNQTIYFTDVAPLNLKQIASVEHTITEAGKEILQNSDCFVSEVVFRVGAGKYFNKAKASTKDGVEMFYDLARKYGLYTPDISLYDGSGVSRYNMMNTDWMTDALIYAYNNVNIKDYMAKPGEGTLKRRLRHLNGKVWAKTGTLKGVSSLSGYVDAKNGSTYAFAIIIQNFNKKPSEIKGFEDDLIDDIFKL